MKYNSVSHITDVYRAFVCPILAILGMLGNVGIIISFAFNINNKFAIYCTSLAIYNFMALLTNTFMDDFLGRGLKYLTNGSTSVDVEVMSSFACVFMEYVPNVMYFASAYVIVAFSIDRVLIIALPVKYSPYRGYKLTIIVCIGIGVLGAAVAGPLLFSYSLIPPSVNSTILLCQLSNVKLGEFGLYLKSVVIFVIPTILVATLNIIIYCHLVRVKRRRRQLSNRKNPQNSNSEMGRIVTHLALSTAFLLLTLPISVTILLRLPIGDKPRNNYEKNIIQLTKLFSSLKDLSYAVNFFLYLVFIPSFKYEFLSVFRCTRPIPQTNDVSLRDKPVDCKYQKRNSLPKSF